MKNSKRKIIYLLVISVLMTLTSFNVEAASGDVVIFDDPLVKGAVNKKLGVTDLNADITEGQLAGLTSLVINETGTITSFKGLEKAYNLNSLDIGKSTDVAAGSSETKIATTDFSPLAGTKIKNFRMFTGDNELTSLDPLLNMTQLQMLTLNTDHISDFEALKSMPQITRLSFYGAEGSPNTIDPSVFQNINPDSIFINYANFTSDFNFSHMTNLTSITITRGNLTDISTLPSNAPISIVNFNFNKDLEDISRLGDIDALTMVNVSGTSVSDISFIRNMDVAKIKALYLYQNKISDVSVLAGLNMPELWALELSNNQINDISAFTTFDSRLETTDFSYYPRGLYLRGNQITDFTPLNKYVGKSAQVIASNQVVRLPEVELGNSTNMPFKDAEGNDLVYYSANDIDSLTSSGATYGTFTLNDNMLTWDEITPADNLGYNRLYGANHDPNATGNAPIGQVIVGINIIQNVVPQVNTLTFDGNTSDVITNLPRALDQELNGSLTIPNQIPTRNNYKFTGWNTKADGSGETYKINETLTLTDDMTIYAMWEKVAVAPVEKPGTIKKVTATGDYSNWLLYTMLIVLSGFILVLTKRKKNY